MSKYFLPSFLVLMTIIGCNQSGTPAFEGDSPPRSSRSAGPPTTTRKPRPNTDYALRFQAAMEISDPSTRGEALASLAASAAAAGEAEVVQRAIASISSPTTRNEAAARAAGELARAGQEEEALAAARQISTPALRDEALKSIAGD